MTSISPTCEKVIAIVADFFMVDPRALSPHSSAVDVPGWDSVTQVGLLMRMEDEFGVELDGTEANKAENLADLAGQIERKQQSL